LKANHRNSLLRDRNLSLLEAKQQVKSILIVKGIKVNTRKGLEWMKLVIESNKEVLIMCQDLKGVRRASRVDYHAPNEEGIRRIEVRHQLG